MKKKAVGERRKQGVTSGERRKEGAAAHLALVNVMQQLVLPLVVGVEATKNGLLAFVHQMGMLALQELFTFEAAAIAGPKGKHVEGRTHHHWGTAKTVLPFGGRNVVVDRPRVRRTGKGGKEIPLPSVEEFRAADPLSERVAEQIVLGVSTRGYDRSIEPAPEATTSRGTSKSSASRALIDKTTEKLTAFLDRRLEDVNMIAMFIDGIEVAKKSVIIALGVTTEGTKVPLGLWIGSTENAVVATELLQNLVERGLRVDGPLLFVIDGGKGIRKALRDVFGDRAVVQRCQVHKMRNVLDHVPEARRNYVRRQMREAYKSKSMQVAKKLLLQLASWLESNGEDSAAASLREGLDESLTVLRFNLPQALLRTFSTTNAIENMNGTLRRISRNVKRWQGESMIRRWMALGISEAQSKFRRVKGHEQMSKLVAALRPNTTTMEVEKKVA
jgi:transposase-like protein